MDCHSLEFNMNEGLWRRRLARVNKDILVKEWAGQFLWDIKNPKSISQARLVDEIIKTISYRKDPDFISFFKSFIQSNALTGKEACYLFYTPSPQELVPWVKSWNSQKFDGQHHEYIAHQKIRFDLKYFLSEDETKTSYPLMAIFLAAISKRPKLIQNGLSLTEVHDTNEIILVLREGSNMIEVRGHYAAVRDFMATAIRQGACTPLRSVQCYFIGQQRSYKGQNFCPTRQFIKINDLRAELGGHYKTIGGRVPGSRILSAEFSVEKFENLGEEDYEPGRQVLETIIQDPAKGVIAFPYQNREYSFHITKTGGLELKQYISEEVLTMIIHQINKISRKIES